MNWIWFVEKIEIIKSAVAEFGPFGIAGTINVITRKIERKKTEQLRIGTNNADGRLSGDLSYSINQNETGSPLSFNAQISAYRHSTATDSELEQTIRRSGLATSANYKASVFNYNQNSDFSANGAVEWKANTRNTITFSPGISSTNFDQGSAEYKNYADGNSRHLQQRTTGPFVFFGLPLNWTYTPTDDSELVLNWNSNRIRSRSEMHQSETISQQATTFRQRNETKDIDSDFLRINYKVSLPDQHDFKAGGHIGYGRNSNEFNNQINGAPDPSLDILGQRRNIRQNQRRLFMQDDWHLSNELALNAGLSFEDRTIDINEGEFHSEVHYHLFSPSVHIAKKSMAMRRDNSGSALHAHLKHRPRISSA
jgi:outer membrane receptor for ferrienterochelin and colicin